MTGDLFDQTAHPRLSIGLSEDVSSGRWDRVSYSPQGCEEPFVSVEDAR